jgi:signal transduction histidine kinase
MIRLQTKPSLYRDFALLAAMILGVLLIVSVWIVLKTYQSHGEDILKKLENEAIRIDRALIVRIEEASYLLESVGRQIDVNSPQLEESILRLFQSFSKSQSARIGGFYWINRNQHIIMSSNAGRLAEPVYIADRDYVKRALTQPWTIQIGQPVMGRVSGAWVIPIALGITDNAGEFIGAVSISLNVEQLSRLIGSVIKEPQIDYAITNMAFSLLTQTAQEDDFFSRYFSMDRLTEIDFDANPSGVFSRASLFASDRIYAYYERSLHYPYIILVGFNPAHSRTTMDSILWPRLLQILVMTLFLLLTLWTVRRRIIQPVIQLCDHTRAVLRGETFAHDNPNDPMEIEQLAGEIRRLSAYIDERRKIERELARKNAELIQIKEAAETTNALKATFFEQVGDALILPSKTIQEYVESLRGELFGPLNNEKYSEMAEAMALECRNILETLEDIRAISHAESGLLALNEKPLDIDFVIKKSVRLLREAAPFQQTEVILDLEEDMPKLRGDELRLKQLLLNLLLSAASESSATDVIRLNTYYLPNEAARIEISYKPARNAQTRQEMLASLPQLRSAVPYSSGFLKLGHALCDLIVAMHGGTLTSKVTPDQMVRKTISLPASRFIL